MKDLWKKRLDKPGQRCYNNLEMIPNLLSKYQKKGRDQEMNSKQKYRTKQKDLMYKFLKSTQGRHFTAADAIRYFEMGGGELGKTTVYRLLEKLVEAGEIKKYIIDTSSSACFEYTRCGDSCKNYHLKCKVCGKLIHLDCSHVTTFEDHIMKEHGFEIDRAGTVFIGICADCQSKGDFSELKEIEIKEIKNNKKI